MKYILPIIILIALLWFFFLKETPVIEWRYQDSGDVMGGSNFTDAF
jgi:hypothetical protein